MGKVQGISGIAGYATGIVQQLANVTLGHVGWPLIVRGDFLEPRSEAAESGADLVDTIVRTITRAPAPADPQKLRAYRPLLAAMNLAVGGAGNGAVRLTFRAAVRNVSWGTPGRESALVAVYVDGKYHSELPLLAERPDEYAVNLGRLGPGEHTIEIRSSIDSQPTLTGRTSISDVQATVVSGIQELIDRNAPILEFEDKRVGSSARPSVSDTPLLLVPRVARAKDGRIIISYHVLFSNEDGGTKTDDLFRRYGRGTDYEMVYRVELSRSGKVLKSWYQGPRHGLYRFEGDHEAGRPVLRVASQNNIFSQRLTGGSRRWSAAAVVPMSEHVESLDVMRRHPWSFAVMGKELLREGRTGVLDKLGVHVPVDSRSFMYLQRIPAPLVDALKGGAQLVAHLADGSQVRLAAQGIDPRRGETSVELPAGVADAVVAISGLGRRGNAFVLDASHRPRSVQLR